MTEIEYGHSFDLGGGDFEEPIIPTRARGWMEPGVQTIDTHDTHETQTGGSSGTVPQMSRPYKGIWPITQFYNPAREHWGLDIGMPTGTQLYAAHAGQVTAARQDNTGYGFVVCIKDDSRGIYSVYGHLNGMAGIGVRVGEWVTERQFIGNSDNTGNSTGPHLHVELRVRPYTYRTCNLDPLKYMQVWDNEPAPPPPTPPPPQPEETGVRRRCWRNAPIRAKKQTTAKIGTYKAGTIIMVGSDNDGWTWVSGQHGQPSGFVKTAHLGRV